MNIVKPRYEIIEQSYNSNLIENMFKHIEICGRTCYKSEDKITDTSYERFIKMLTDSEHGAMLEHGTIYLWMEYGRNRNESDRIQKYLTNPHSKWNCTYNNYFITTNYRVMVENGWLDDLEYMCKPTEHHEKRYTVRFTCDIGVSREFNRHRVDSIGEESTRYCNYSKEKFGGELNYIEPVFLTDDEKEILNDPKEHLSFQSMCNQISNGTYYSSFEAIDYFIFVLEACEFSYMNLIKLGWKPQQARIVLPLDIKTELVHTAFASDWCHFFNLRALGTTGAPHPAAKELAWPLMEEFLKNRWITEDKIKKEKYHQIKEKYPVIEDYIKL